MKNTTSLALLPLLALLFFPTAVIAGPGLAIGGKDKGEAEQEDPPVDVHGLLPGFGIRHA